MTSAGPPTPYVPPGLPLPYYARPDLAYLEGIYLPAAPAGSTWNSSAPEGAIERVLYAWYQVTLSAVVSSRVPLLFYRDATGAVIWQVASPGSSPANAVMQVTVISGPGQSFANGNTHVVYVPDTLIDSSSKLTFGFQNGDAADVVNFVHFNRHVIPTGPTLETQTVTTAAVPLT